MLEFGISLFDSSTRESQYYEVCVKLYKEMMTFGLVSFICFMLVRISWRVRGRRLGQHLDHETHRHVQRHVQQEAHATELDLPQQALYAVEWAHFM